MQFISKPKIILAVPKQSLILGYYTTVNHFERYVEIRAFSDPFFPVFGQNQRFCRNTRKYGYPSVHKRRNTDHRKPVFRHILHSG